MHANVYFPFKISVSLLYKEIITRGEKNSVYISDGYCYTQNTLISLYISCIDTKVQVFLRFVRRRSVILNRTGFHKTILLISTILGGISERTICFKYVVTFVDICI